MEHGIVDCDSNTEVLSSLKILGTSARSLQVVMEILMVLMVAGDSLLMFV